MTSRWIVCGAWLAVACAPFPSASLPAADFEVGSDPAPSPPPPEPLTLDWDQPFTAGEVTTLTVTGASAGDTVVRPGDGRSASADVRARAKEFAQLLGARPVRAKRAKSN